MDTLISMIRSVRNKFSFSAGLFVSMLLCVTEAPAQGRKVNFEKQVLPFFASEKCTLLNQNNAKLD